MDEIEARFLLTRQQYEEIKDYFTGKKKYRKSTIISINEELLETTYYDTEQRHLSNARAALRIRKVGNQYYLAFKKKQLPSDKVIQVRKENEILLAQEPSLEDGSLSPVAEARILVGQHPLRTIVTMKTRRTIFYFTQPSFVVEMALDTVHILKPQEQDFFELEIELKKGNPELLRRFAEQLTADFGITATRTTKIGRALGINEEGE